MAAKDLKNDEMLSVSAGWMDTNEDMFVGDDAPLKALFVPLSNAHKALVSLDKRDHERGREERELTVAIGEYNKGFDQAVCGFYWGMVAGKYLARDSEAAQKFHDVSLAILPEGRSVTKSSYRQQAGAAIYAQERLTPDVVDLLKSVVYDGHSLHDQVLYMIEIAKKLSSALDRRSQISTKNNGAIHRKEEREARAMWIDVATNILSVASVIGLSADEMTRLRANYDDADAKAVRRRKVEALAKKKKREKAKKDKEMAGKTEDETPETTDETHDVENQDNADGADEDESTVSEEPEVVRQIETDPV